MAILQELLKETPFAKELEKLSKEEQTIEILGLSSDSRYAKAGDLFFAQSGATSHGLDYLPELEKRGVSFILYEAKPGVSAPKTIPSIGVEQSGQLEEWMRRLTLKVYRDLGESLQILGVTGTEGKTSVTQFIAKAFEALGIRCGLVGTNGIGFLHALKENTHTTPDLLALYRSLSELKGQFTADLHPVGLEVTSHALDQKRVEGLHFSTTILTNLTRDHLDYHGTVEAYGKAKARLFLEYTSENSVINIDDPFGEAIYAAVQEKFPERRLYPYGMKAFSAENYLQISRLRLHPEGLRFTLQFAGRSYAIESHLFGKFNAYNLVAAMGALLSLGVSLEKIIAITPAITNVKGRMEMVHLNNGAVAVVDYAHKPNALLQALCSLREHITEGRLVSLFGCGGDRDKGKRPLMAAISEEHADHVVITSDNPRFEDPLMIIEEIKAGLKNPSAENISIEPDRGAAIRHAILNSQKGDIILIAGKGHEEYQIIGDKVVDFSDIDEVNRYNKEL